MLDKQEQDRLNEFKAREHRAQEFMNKMADTVIKNMDNKAREEEEKIKRYEMEKELRERIVMRIYIWPNKWMRRKTENNWKMYLTTNKRSCGNMTWITPKRKEG